jgi:cytoskeletal protein CcmA (bactofilin family)
LNTDHTPALDELLQINPQSIRSLIDRDVHFEGKLSVRNDSVILVSGEITGEIHSEGVVIINADAVVHGSIRAKGLQVGGRVVRRSPEDRLDVEGVLVLAKGARLEVDAVYGDLKAEHGVRISGNLSPREMDQEAVGERRSAQVLPLAQSA